MRPTGRGGAREDGVVWGWAFLGAGVFTLLAGATGGDRHLGATLGGFAVVAGWLGSIATARSVPLVAATCWLFYDGFFVHRNARLTWEGGPDAQRFALLLGAAAAGLLVHRAVRGPGGAGQPLTGVLPAPPARPNPLLRDTDRARARVRTVVRYLMVACFVLACFVAASAERTTAQTAAATRGVDHAVTAHTIAVAAQPLDPSGKPLRGVYPGLVETAVSWDYPAGTAHGGFALVPVGRPVGTPVPVWVDPHGDQVVPPATRAELVLEALGVGGMTFLACGGLVLTVGWTLRRHYDRRDERAWGEAWARFEPEWSGRHRPGHLP
ncbi:hypothetical protein ABH932_007630 [Streptacidiphilus sp. MAP5-52]